MIGVFDGFDNPTKIIQSTTGMTSLKQIKNQIAFLEELHKHKYKQDYSTLLTAIKKPKPNLLPHTSLPNLIYADHSLDTNGQDVEKYLKDITEVQVHSQIEQQHQNIALLLLARYFYKQSDYSRTLQLLNKIKPVKFSELGGVDLRIVWPSYEPESEALKARCLYKNKQTKEALDALRKSYEYVEEKPEMLNKLNDKSLYRLEDLMLDYPKILEELRFCVLKKLLI